jgi:hypothetical protein
MAQGMRIRGVELDDAGAAIDGTDNVKLYAVDQTSTAVATASTDASGLWAFDHASQGRFDVKITNGSDIVWIRARDEFQVTTIQARNPTTANAAGHFMSTVPIATDTASLVATFGFRPSQESSGVETPDTPTDGISGRIDYELSNDNVPVDQWIAGRFEWEGVDVSDGSEDGQLNWWTMVAGTLTEELHLDATALWPEAAGGLALGKATLGYADLFLEDAADIQFGAGQDVLMRWSAGDASNHSFVIGLGDSNQAFHITDKNAVATDWNIAATTHPNLYIHSNTTPATDFLRLGDHDGTTAYIDVMGGTTLAFQIAGTSELTLTATVLSPVSDATTDLGATAVGFNDLHLGSGGVVNFDGGDVTLTHAAGKLTLGGDGAVELDFANHEMTNVDINSGAIDGTTYEGIAAADVIRKHVWIPASGGHVAGTATGHQVNGRYAASTIGDATNDGNVFITGAVPTDFNTLQKAVFVFSSSETANTRLRVLTFFAAAGEAEDLNNESTVEATVGVTADENAELDISAALTGLAAGDYIGFQCHRSGADDLDTITTLYAYGVLIEYT